VLALIAQETALMAADAHDRSRRGSPAARVRQSRSPFAACRSLLVERRPLPERPVRPMLVEMAEVCEQHLAVTAAATMAGVC
jgi:hypothetical protein